MRNPNKPSTSSRPSSSSSQKPHSSSSNRKSRWESGSDRPSVPKDLKPPKQSNPTELANKDIPSSAAAVAAAGATPSPVDPGVPPRHAASGGRGGSPFSGHPPPIYGFENLERRTIALFDGSVRSYLALPPDYPQEPYGHGVRPEAGMGLPFDRRFSPDCFRDLPRFGRDFGPPGPLEDGRWRPGPLPSELRGPLDGDQASIKRKHPEDDELTWHRQHISQYGNPNPGVNPNPHRSPMRRGYEDDMRSSKQVRMGGGDGFEETAVWRGRTRENFAVPDVDPQALKMAFLKSAKTVIGNAGQRNNYLDDGKNGPLHCVVCGRASEEFSDVHGLIMHAYNSQSANLRVDHLGLHKALCVLMGWNYAKAPENSKAYQSLPADVASANREDLIMWPPTVIIHNTNSGKRKDGHTDGMGNKYVDMKLKDLGFGAGKAKSIYCKEGHVGASAVKFTNNQAGLKEAQRLAEYFEKDNHGRKGWARAQASLSGGDEDKNPAIVKVDPESGEKQRIFYGYLATAYELSEVYSYMRKKAEIKSITELDPSD